jgi:hypothetical protein
MSSYFLRFFSFYERNCITSKLRSRDAAPKNLFSTDAPDGWVALSASTYITIHHVRGVWGVFVPYFCVVCEGGRRIEVGRQAGRRRQVEKRKRKKKKSIQHGPVLCCLVLSCPIRFMPYPLVFDWHKNAWSFGTFSSSSFFHHV